MAGTTGSYTPPQSLEPFTLAQKGLAQAWEIQRGLRVWRPRRAAVMGAGTIGLVVTLALRLRGLTGLENYAELFATLGHARAAIKVFCEVADDGTAA